MKLLPIVTLLVAFALLLGTTMSRARPLFEQIDRRGDTDTRPTRHELRRATVTMTSDSLVSGPGGSGTEVLTLHLFPDEEPLKAHLTELQRRGRENFTWYGITEDDPRSLVMLTAVGGYVDGTVLHHDRMFRIEPSRSGAHFAIGVARDSFGDVDNVDLRFEFPPDDSPTDPRLDWINKPWFKDMFRIDVLVAFTAQVLYAYGGAIHAKIQSNIDMTNINLYASGVATQLRLVHTEPEFYNELANLNRQFASQVLSDLGTKNDGLLDEVHVQRDAHAADIVVLLTKWDEDCGDPEDTAGLAPQLNGFGNGPGASSAFAVVDVDCAINNFVFSHEVGHLLGAGHDALASKPPATVVPYARGYIVHSVKSRSIMSYNTACEDAKYNCTVAPLYSNPDYLYLPSEPFGSPTDADNRRRMNELTTWVSGFR